MLKYQSIRNLYISSKPKPWPIEKPKVIQFPVNDICNSKCQMCHIWKQKRGFEITPDQLKNALKNDLYSEVTYIGINGGEPTLREDLPALVDSIFCALPKVKHISLITNALNSKQVIQRIKSITKVINKYNGKLDVMVSLDGVGDVHDIVRGRKGNFNSATQVLDYARNSPDIFNVRIGCTIIKSNVFGIYNLLNYARSINTYIKYRLGVPHKRLYTSNIKEPFILDTEETHFLCTFIKSLVDEYETSLQQKVFYLSLIDQLLYKKPRRANCDWQHRGATITSDGNLSYCAIASPNLGSIIDNSSYDLYFENKHKLTNIISSSCSDCMHDYMGLSNTSDMLRMQVKPKIKNFMYDKIRKMHLYNNIHSIEDNISYKKYKIKHNHDKYSNTPMMPHKEKNGVLVCGWYGTETTGDKSILAGVIISLRSLLSNNKLYIASFDPTLTELTAKQIPDLKAATVLSINEALEKLMKMNLLVLAGGPIMGVNEINTIRQFFLKANDNQVLSLIAGCGIGPFRHNFYKKDIIDILNLSDFRIFRDTRSKCMAEKLNIDTTFDLVAEDPAFTWIKSIKHKSSCRIKKSKLTVLLALRLWPFNQYATNIKENKCIAIQDKFENELVHALNMLTIDYPNLTILPVPMCSNSYGGNDIWYYYNLFSKYNINLKNYDLTCLQNEYPPDVIFEYFYNADAVLAMRFHSIVFSLGANTPVVAIDYTMGKGKINSIANKFNLPCKTLDQADATYIYQHLKNHLSTNKRIMHKDEMKLNFQSSISSFLSTIDN